MFPLPAHFVCPEYDKEADIQLQPCNRGDKLSANPFVETTLSYVLTYIDHVSRSRGGITIGPSRLIILADNDYYSNQGTAHGRFAKFSVALSGAHKTGLGSSAALVTSLTASLLTHYLPAEAFDVQSTAGKRALHNLAQAAHCAAQGKVGSGFDVAAAVYGSCLYRRFSPETLSGLPEPGAPGFSAKLVETVDGMEWDVEVQKEGLSIPAGIGLRMCDVDCGSQTPGMVKKVLAWKGADPKRAGTLWEALQQRNEDLARSLRDGVVDELPGNLTSARKLIREMGQLSDVPIEPSSQTELLDAVSGVAGVYGGVVPGAGGFDALVLLVKDDEETVEGVEAFLGKWSEEKQSNVKLLPVKGEMEGVRSESLDVYEGWL